LHKRDIRNCSNYFKEQIVKLVIGGATISQVAREHALPKSTVYTWVAMYKRNGGFYEKNSVFELVAELAKLRNENRLLAQENRLLKLGQM